MSFLLGNLIGLCYSVLVPNSFTNVFFSLGVLCLMQSYFVYQSVSTLNFKDFNLQRAYYLAEEYLATNKIIDLYTLNRKERIFFILKDIIFSQEPLEKLLKATDRLHITKLIEIYRDTKFLVYPYGNKLYVYIHIDAEQIDIFLALLYVMHLRSITKGKYGDDIYSKLLDCLTFINNINRQKLIAAIEAQHYDVRFEKLEEKYLRYNII
jgi:hypothetical protein